MSEQDTFEKISNLIDQLRETQIENSKLNGRYWKNEFKDLVDFLESSKDEAQHQYDNMKENGLQFSTIETEGYLKGLTFAFNLAKDAYESAFNNADEDRE